MSHTPGPWEVVVEPGKHIVVGVRNRGIALITNTDMKIAPEKLANARLIAAAPELLEELHEMLDYAREALYWAGGEEETRGKAPRVKMDIERVEALLKWTATGEDEHHDQP